MGLVCILVFSRLQQSKGRRIYFGSQFQKVWPMVSWPSALGLNIMAAQVCGTEELLHLMVNMKQRER
jgi:hypothetical protein